MKSSQPCCFDKSCWLVITRSAPTRLRKRLQVVRITDRAGWFIVNCRLSIVKFTMRLTEIFLRRSMQVVEYCFKTTRWRLVITRCRTWAKHLTYSYGMTAVQVVVYQMSTINNVRSRSSLLMIRHPAERRLNICLFFTHF